MSGAMRWDAVKRDPTIADMGRWKMGRRAPAERTRAIDRIGDV